jgi:hypothetical protein
MCLCESTPLSREFDSEVLYDIVTILSRALSWYESNEVVDKGLAQAIVALSGS